MKAALASTVELLAAEAMVRALTAGGLGFYDLAIGNFSGAASAFEAAAIWGSAGAAAAVGGRTIAPPQGAATGAGAGPARIGGGASSGADTGAVSAAGRRAREEELKTGKTPSFAAAFACGVSLVLAVRHFSLVTNIVRLLDI